MCQIPDFRQIAESDHTNLLANVFNLLKKALSHLSGQYSLQDIELLIVGSNKTDDISIKDRFEKQKNYTKY